MRRKPWAYGEGAFHSLYRYSCQHSHFRYLQGTFRFPFAGVRNALLLRIRSLQFTRPALNELKWNVYTRSFGVQFEPRYIFRAGRLDQ